MLKRIFPLISILILTTPLQVKSQPLSLDISGYYRTRADMFVDYLDLDSSDRNTTSYLEHRFRLSPRLTISERVVLKSQWDILDNVLWGYNNPSDIGGHAFTQTPDSYDRGGDTDNLFLPKRVWGEIITPVGKLELGRMPSHWGAGIMANNGDGIDDDYGDTYDRILFATRIGPVYVIPIYDKITEGPIESEGPSAYTDAEADEYILVSFYKEEDNLAGVYLADRRQVYFGTVAQIVDLYLRWHLGDLKVEVEGATIQGKTEIALYRVDVEQYGGVIKVDYRWPAVSLLLELGYASGPAPGEFEPDTLEGSDLNRFVFDPDYNVDLLMFEEIVGREYSPDGLKGTINNALYSKLGMDMNWGSFQVGISLIWAQMLKGFREAEYPHKHLGIECDLDVGYRLARHFEVGTQIGYLFAGDGLMHWISPESDERPDNPFTSQGYFRLEF